MSVSAVVMALGCSPGAPQPHVGPPSMDDDELKSHVADEGPRFETDLAFLRRYGEVIVLEAEHGGRIAVSPSYQGRVMTSAVSEDGASLGYLNRSFIEKGESGTAFDNYGGEDRFWLGPEGGPHALYFAPGDEQDFVHWQTPAALQEGAWEVVERTPLESSSCVL